MKSDLTRIDLLARIKSLKKELVYYKSKIPCEHGHVGVRYSVNGQCAICGKTKGFLFDMNMESVAKFKPELIAELRKKAGLRTRCKYLPKGVLLSSAFDNANRANSMRKGLVNYQSEIPCSRKHIGIRRTCNGDCVFCQSPITNPNTDLKRATQRTTPYEESHIQAVLNGVLKFYSENKKHWCYTKNGQYCSPPNSAFDDINNVTTNDEKRNSQTTQQSQFKEIELNNNGSLQANQEDNLQSHFEIILRQMQDQALKQLRETYEKQIADGNAKIEKMTAKLKECENEIADQKEKILKQAEIIESQESELNKNANMRAELDDLLNRAAQLESKMVH